MGADLLHLELSGADAALAAALRKTLRTPGSGALALHGDLSVDLDEAGAAAGWLALVLQAPRPVILRCEGVIGQRGLALMLAADRTSLAPAAALAANWRDAPGLAALAMRRGGPALARALLLGDEDSTARLVELGLASHETAEALATAFDDGWGRRKRSLRAALELPFNEALDFEFAVLEEASR